MVNFSPTRDSTYTWKQVLMALMLNRSAESKWRKHQPAYQTLCHQLHYTSLLAKGFVYRAGTEHPPYGLVFSVYLCARVSLKMIIIHNGCISSVPVWTAMGPRQAACWLVVGLSPPGFGWLSISQKLLEQNEKQGKQNCVTSCWWSQFYQVWVGFWHAGGGEKRVFIPVGWQSPTQRNLRGRRQVCRSGDPAGVSAHGFVSITCRVFVVKW